MNKNKYRYCSTCANYSPKSSYGGACSFLSLQLQDPEGVIAIGNSNNNVSAEFIVQSSFYCNKYKDSSQLKSLFTEIEK